MKTNKNLLEQKLELQKKPFYTEGRHTNRQNQIDNDTFVNVEIEIQKQWLKHPNWIKDFGTSPYIPAVKLPKKGTEVLFITFDKIKDKKESFGFRLENYRIEKGTFNGIKVSKKMRMGEEMQSLYVKVVSKGYIYFLSATDVIVA